MRVFGRVIGGFLRAETGGATSDTLVALLVAGLFFSVIMAMNPNGNSHFARLGSPTIQIGGGWSFGDDRPRLPRIGPLHTRR